MTNKQSTLQQTQQLAAKFGGIALVLFIFAIYFSTGLTSIMSIILGVCWLVAAQFKTIPSILKTQPVAFWSALLFACFLFGLSYGDTSLNQGFKMAGKYRELIYIPILMGILNQQRYRNWAWRAFVAASVITLLISYLQYAGAFALNEHGDACVKSRITHSIFISFFAYYCFQKSYSNTSNSKYYLALGLLSLYNLFFVVGGRTGQAGMLILILLFALQRFNKKGILLTIAGICVGMALFISFSEKAKRIQEGLDDTQTLIHQSQTKTVKKSDSAMGYRFVYWRNAAKLIVEKPLLGHGTGSFAKEYLRVEIDKRFATKNPHNELLMIWVQLGIIGVIIYLGFLTSLYRQAKGMNTDQKYLAHGLLLTLIITSLFNSPILDLAEGHWFATFIALCYGIAPAKKPSV